MLKRRTHKRCFEIMTKWRRLYLPDVAVSSYRGCTRIHQIFTRYPCSLNQSWVEYGDGSQSQLYRMFTFRICTRKHSRFSEAFNLLTLMHSFPGTPMTSTSPVTLAMTTSRQHKLDDHLHSIKRLPRRKYFSSYFETG